MDDPITIPDDGGVPVVTVAFIPTRPTWSDLVRPAVLRRYASCAGGVPESLLSQSPEHQAFLGNRIIKHWQFARDLTDPLTLQAAMTAFGSRIL